MKIYCDSSTKEACYVIEGQKPVIVTYSKPVTNNVGEYQAVVIALVEAQRLKTTGIELLTDSEFVVNQVRGYDKFGHTWERCLPHLLPYRDKVRELLANSYWIELKWIPRGENLAGKVLG